MAEKSIYGPATDDEEDEEGLGTSTQAESPEYDTSGGGDPAIDEEDFAPVGAPTGDPEEDPEEDPAEDPAATPAGDPETAPTETPEYNASGEGDPALGDPALGDPALGDPTRDDPAPGPEGTPPQLDTPENPANEPAKTEEDAPPSTAARILDALNPVSAANAAGRKLFLPPAEQRLTAARELLAANPTLFPGLQGKTIDTDEGRQSADRLALSAALKAGDLGEAFVKGGENARSAVLRELARERVEKQFPVGTRVTGGRVNAERRVEEALYKSTKDFDVRTVPNVVAAAGSATPTNTVPTGGKNSSLEDKFKAWVMADPERAKAFANGDSTTRARTVSLYAGGTADKMMSSAKIRYELDGITRSGFAKPAGPAKKSDEAAPASTPASDPKSPQYGFVEGTRNVGAGVIAGLAAMVPGALALAASAGEATAKRGLDSLGVDTSGADSGGSLSGWLSRKSMEIEKATRNALTSTEGLARQKQDAAETSATVQKLNADYEAGKINYKEWIAARAAGWWDQALKRPDVAIEPLAAIVGPLVLGKAASAANAMTRSATVATAAQKAVASGQVSYKVAMTTMVLQGAHEGNRAADAIYDMSDADFMSLPYVREKTFERVRSGQSADAAFLEDLREQTARETRLIVGSANAAANMLLASNSNAFAVAAGMKDKVATRAALSTAYVGWAFGKEAAVSGVSSYGAGVAGSFAQQKIAQDFDSRATVTDRLKRAATDPSAGFEGMLGGAVGGVIGGPLAARGGSRIAGTVRADRLKAASTRPPTGPTDPSKPAPVTPAGLDFSVGPRPEDDRSFAAFSRELDARIARGDSREDALRVMGEGKNFIPESDPAKLLPKSLDAVGLRRERDRLKAGEETRATEANDRRTAAEAAKRAASEAATLKEYKAREAEFEATKASRIEAAAQERVARIGNDGARVVDEAFKAEMAKDKLKTPAGSRKYLQALEATAAHDKTNPTIDYRGTRALNTVEKRAARNYYLTKQALAELPKEAKGDTGAAPVRPEFASEPPPVTLPVTPPVTASPADRDMTGPAERVRRVRERFSVDGKEDSPAAKLALQRLAAKDPAVAALLKSEGAAPLDAPNPVVAEKVDALRAESRDAMNTPGVQRPAPDIRKLAEDAAVKAMNDPSRSPLEALEELKRAQGMPTEPIEATPAVREAQITNALKDKPKLSRPKVEARAAEITETIKAASKPTPEPAKTETTVTPTEVTVARPAKVDGLKKPPATGNVVNDRMAMLRAAKAKIMGPDSSVISRPAAPVTISRAPPPRDQYRAATASVNRLIAEGTIERTALRTKIREMYPDMHVETIRGLIEGVIRGWDTPASIVDRIPDLSGRRPDPLMRVPRFPERQPVVVPSVDYALTQRALSSLYTIPPEVQGERAAALVQAIEDVMGPLPPTNRVRLLLSEDNLRTVDGTGEVEGLALQGAALGPMETATRLILAAPLFKRGDGVPTYTHELIHAVWPYMPTADRQVLLKYAEAASQERFADSDVYAGGAMNFARFYSYVQLYQGRPVITAAVKNDLMAQELVAHWLPQYLIDRAAEQKLMARKSSEKPPHVPDKVPSDVKPILSRLVDKLRDIQQRFLGYFTDKYGPQHVDKLDGDTTQIMRVMDNILDHTYLKDGVVNPAKETSRLVTENGITFTDGSSGSSVPPQAATFMAQLAEPLPRPYGEIAFAPPGKPNRAYPPETLTLKPRINMINRKGGSEFDVRKAVAVTVELYDKQGDLVIYNTFEKHPEHKNWRGENLEYATRERQDAWAGKGVANYLYDITERHVNARIAPSELMLRDGFRMNSKRHEGTPLGEVLKLYRDTGTVSPLWSSPARLAELLNLAETSVKAAANSVQAATQRRDFNKVVEHTATWRARVQDRDRLKALQDSLPPDAILRGNKQSPLASSPIDAPTAVRAATRVAADFARVTTAAGERLRFTYYTDDTQAGGTYSTRVAYKPGSPDITFEINASRVGSEAALHREMHSKLVGIVGLTRLFDMHPQGRALGLNYTKVSLAVSNEALRYPALERKWRGTYQDYLNNGFPDNADTAHKARLTYMAELADHFTQGSPLYEGIKERLLTQTFNRLRDLVGRVVPSMRRITAADMAEVFRNSQEYQLGHRLRSIAVQGSLEASQTTLRDEKALFDPTRSFYTRSTALLNDDGLFNAIVNGVIRNTQNPRVRGILQDARAFIHARKTLLVNAMAEHGPLREDSSKALVALAQALEAANPTRDRLALGIKGKLPQLQDASRLVEQTMVDLHIGERLDALWLKEAKLTQGGETARKQLIKDANDALARDPAPNPAEQRTLAANLRRDLTAVVNGTMLAGQVQERDARRYATRTRDDTARAQQAYASNPELRAAVDAYKAMVKAAERENLSNGRLHPFVHEFYGFQNYVPMKGRTEEVLPFGKLSFEQMGMQSSVLGRYENGLIGRDTPVQGVLAAVEHDLDFSAKNRVDNYMGGHMRNLASAMPDKYAQTQDNTGRKRAWRYATPMQIQMDGRTSAMFSHPAIEALNGKTAAITYYDGQSGKHIIVEPRYKELYSPYAQEEKPISGSSNKTLRWGKLSWETVLEKARWFNRTRGALLTAFRPAQLAVQSFRDFTHGWAHSGRDIGLYEGSKDFMRNLFAPEGTATARFQLLLAGASDRNAIVNQWRNDPTMAQRNRYLIEAHDNGLILNPNQQFYRDGQYAQRVLDRVATEVSPRGLTAMFHNVKRPLEAINEVSDSIYRLAYYAALRDNNVPVSDAIVRARNMMNWDARSATSRSLSPLYMFATPKANGLYHMVHNDIWKGGVAPNKMTMLPSGRAQLELREGWRADFAAPLMATYVALPALMTLAVIRMMGKDEEGEWKAKKTMTADSLGRYVHLPIPGLPEGATGRVPYQFGAQVMGGNAGSLMVAASHGIITWKDAAREMGNTIRGELPNPLNKTNDEGTNHLGSSLVQVTPHVLFADMLVAWGVNANNFGHMIRPPAGPGTEKMRDSDRSFNNTAQIHKDLARYLADHKIADVHPEVFKEAVKGMGALGDVINFGATVSGKGPGGSSPTDTLATRTGKATATFLGADRWYDTKTAQYASQREANDIRRKVNKFEQERTHARKVDEENNARSLKPYSRDIGPREQAFIDANRAKYDAIKAAEKVQRSLNEEKKRASVGIGADADKRREVLDRQAKAYEKALRDAFKN